MRAVEVYISLIIAGYLFEVFVGYLVAFIFVGIVLYYAKTYSYGS